MVDLPTLVAQRDRLAGIRAKGVKSYEIAVEGSTRRMEYRSDAEIAAAIAELDRQIAAASSGQPVRSVHITYSKGT
jgi:hypothetical protein